MVLLEISAVPDSHGMVIRCADNLGSIGREVGAPYMVGMSSKHVGLPERVAVPDSHAILNAKGYADNLAFWQEVIHVEDLDDWREFVHPNNRTMFSDGSVHHQSRCVRVSKYVRALIFIV